MGHSYFFKDVSCAYCIKIEVEFITTPTTTTEQHMNQQKTPPRLSNNMTIRSKPLDRDHGYHQPNLLTMIMTEDDLLRKLKDTTTTTPARKTTPGRGGGGVVVAIGTGGAGQNFRSVNFRSLDHPRLRTRHQGTPPTKAKVSQKDPQ
jgi:hypothetical protein